MSKCNARERLIYKRFVVAGFRCGIINFGCYGSIPAGIGDRNAFMTG
jgi:hypothetical protein